MCINANKTLFKASIQLEEQRCQKLSYFSGKQINNTSRKRKKYGVELPNDVRVGGTNDPEINDAAGKGLQHTRVAATVPSCNYLELHLFVNRKRPLQSKHSLNSGGAAYRRHKGGRNSRHHQRHRQASHRRRPKESPTTVYIDYTSAFNLL